MIYELAFFSSAEAKGKGKRQSLLLTLREFVLVRQGCWLPLPCGLGHLGLGEQDKARYEFTGALEAVPDLLGAKVELGCLATDKLIIERN